MLFLKRNGRFNELYKCQISGEKIFPGDYYYEDDEDGLIVKATVYRDLLDKKIEDEFDYKKLEKAESLRDYEDELKKAETEYLTLTLFDRKVAGKE